MNQSSPPWRVFDAPSGAQSEPGGPTGAAGPSLALARGPLALAGVAAALLIGGLAVVVAMGGTGASAVAGPNAEVEAGSSASADGALLGGVVVDVAGAVATPGLYRLAAGSRVGDAIDAAGGFGPRVDVARVGQELNLAATLTDGQHIRVPSRDDERDPGGASGGSGAAGSGGLVNVNDATQAELEALPGIGPVTAGKIIESRSESPFRTVDELRERGLVGEKTFASIRALISVG